MKNIFQFWEDVIGYNVRVLNEREVRGASWILFVFAIYFIWQYFLDKHNAHLVNKWENKIYKVDDWNDDCEVPEWAIKIWHKEMWKLHHWCK